MLHMPLQPRAGNEVFGWAQNIHAYIKSITPCASNSIRVSRTPSGTTFSRAYEDETVTRFLVEQSAEYDNAVVVYIGRWTRNGYITELVPDVDKTYKTITGLAVSTNYYITLKLTHTDVALVGKEKDPNIMPDTLTVSAETTTPSESIFRNVEFVIAHVITDSDGKISITQVHTGDIDDNSITLNSDSIFADKAPDLKTIARRPAIFDGTNSEHENEICLYGEWFDWKNQYRFPFLPQNADNDGVLTWGVFDSDFTGLESGSRKSIQLHAESGLYWGQIFQFDNPAAYETLLDDDKVMIRGNALTTPSVEYITYADLADKIASEIGDSTLLSHHDLSGLNDGVDDADHAWAMCNSYSANYDSTYVRNYCESLGRTTAIMAIDMTNMKLHKDLATATLDWNNQKLLNGTWYCDGGFLPDDDLTHSLGGSSNIWTDVHAFVHKIYDADGDFHGNIYGTDAGIIIDSEEVVLFDSDIDPLANNSYDIGSSTANWKDLYLAGVVYIDGEQVLGSQQAAEADIADTSGADSDGTCRAKLNALLAKLRTHGIIDT